MEEPPEFLRGPSDEDEGRDGPEEASDGPCDGPDGADGPEGCGAGVGWLGVGAGGSPNPGGKMLSGLSWLNAGSARSIADALTAERLSTGIQTLRFNFAIISQLAFYIFRQRNRLLHFYHLLLAAQPFKAK